jgi:hypothetical protein
MTAALFPFSRVDRRPVLIRPAVGIDDVADNQAAEFDAFPVEVISKITMGARRDLEREVPPESLAEFTHRVSRQRLVDLLQERRGACDLTVIDDRGAA